jgi:hypothetical protein
MTEPAKVDPEVAASTFAAHLDDFFANGRGGLPGWRRIDLGPLQAVVAIPARRADGTVDEYLVLLGADFYPVWPPSVSFVERAGQGWIQATPGSSSWPEQKNSPGFSFHLHATYDYTDGSKRQLVCFSHSFDYYVSGHSPTEEERWIHGIHTVTATLSRLAEVLRSPNYERPSGDPGP